MRGGLRVGWLVYGCRTYLQYGLRRWLLLSVSHKPPPLCIVVRVRAYGSHVLA